MIIESSNFYTALNSVASIILSNPNYDQILGHKVNKDEYQQLDQLSLEEKKEHATRILKNYFENSYTKSLIINCKSDVFAWAKTANNLKELEFFSNLLKKYYQNISIDNIATVEISKRERTELKNDIIYSIKKFYRTATDVTKSLIEQHRQLIQSYLNIKVGMENAGHLPKLAFVANDHSPQPVAFATVMRELGVPVIYFQHAEITKSFPPLNFEFSVLRNERSRVIYKKLGADKGRVYVIGRNTQKDAPKNPFDYINSLNNDLNILPRVVIYPSAIFEDHELGRLFDHLMRNTCIESVSIKPHPGTRPELKDLLEKIYSKHLILETPKTPHIAITGNSSVVIELLSEGNPVWNYFLLDNIDRDYYGFAEAGITQTLEFPDLKEKFWNFNHEKIIQSTKNLSEFDPSMSEFSRKHTLVETHRFLRDLAVHLAPKTQAHRIKKEFWIESCIFSFPNAFIESLRNSKNLGIHGLVATKKLQRLFDIREPHLIRALSLVDVDCLTSDAGAWLYFKRIEWTGHRPSHADSMALERFVYSIDGKNELLPLFENSLLTEIIRSRDPVRLKTFIENARVTKLSNLHINRRIALFRWKNESPEHFLDICIDDARNNLSGLDELKLLVQGNPSNSIMTHDELQNKFYLNAPAEIKQELELYVFPAFHAIKDQMIYMDVGRNQFQTNNLINLVSEKLASKKAFSAIRLSDGEGYIFQRQAIFFGLEDVKNRERHWWGTELSVSHREDLVCLLEKSIVDADILGIPSTYRLLRDTVDKSKSYQSNVPGRGILEVLNGIKNLSNSSIIFADDKFNLAVLRDKKNLDLICKNASKVVMVCSAQPDEIRRVFEKIADPAIISIPTHFKTASNEKYTKQMKPLPFVLDEVLCSLQSLASPGTLCLVSAGVAGKAIIAEAKRLGAVGLDVGSALDEWINAGIHSLH